MDYLLGYGSLLSKHSREHYSRIYSPVKAVRLSGWSRSWCAAYPDENATYAGAQPKPEAQLDAILLPTTIDQDLQMRERNYHFIELKPEDLSLVEDAELPLNATDRVLICATASPTKASNQMPLPQSYVDTCMLGCLEISGIDGMRRFVQQTQGWDGVWFDDRHLNQPIYPRFAKPTRVQQQLIDDVLAQERVLGLRRALR